ncbi:hypothetical protein [Kitasatospora paracochleata]|uniref:Uncharacterized protein n=1 Tax=Kitasatospora paracochleata TaxID=58354 RepID=A0ABT1J0E8_9ACTN|nr:hypothetical protein [Kitasatospora paracochleata]MCP2310867.1 hypothetical protein [Kitasatospora paracochleata]MCP2314288.1 hypothetical protein [Kitasatospora paracochleata]
MKVLSEGVDTFDCDSVFFAERRCRGAGSGVEKGRPAGEPTGRHER